MNDLTSLQDRVTRLSEAYAKDRAILEDLAARSARIESKVDEYKKEAEKLQAKASKMSAESKLTDAMIETLKQLKTVAAIMEEEFERKEGKTFEQVKKESGL